MSDGKLSGSNFFGSPSPLTPQIFNNETFHWNDTLEYGYGDIGYFSLMPVYIFTSPGNGSWTLQYSSPTSKNNTIQTELDELGGQIWIAISAAMSNDTKQTQMESINCQLYDSSLIINVSFLNHVSTITIIESQWMNDISTPLLLHSASNSSQTSYITYFQELSTYLTESVFW